MAGSILSWRTTRSTTWAGECVATEIVCADAAQRDTSRIEIETLYAIRRPEVIRFLVRFGVNAIEAEDITQEAFLRACKPSESKKSSDHLFSWLLVCARNIAIKRYWRGKYEVQAPSSAWQEWEETIPDRAHSLESTIEEQERFERYLCALSQLSDVEQQVVFFRGQGQTFREIAATLDMPLRSAIYTASVAMQKLQRKLRNG